MSVEKKPTMVGGYSLFSLLAFIFGFIFWPIAVVFGVLALQEMKQHQDIRRESKYFAWIGIAFQPVFAILGFIFFMIVSAGMFMV